ncbi:hypothetical protein BDV95DRAFT_58235 [Massariosphaeria phaeospora]|uniref:Uncharacterized protein n=1 Tax=Massariosphaeria phaeospora TaxID=100035 RepID=A0A7C8MBH3_9PLEO|nr:hypothetical protein BDV95DRAFT_58235 [Massariosphaeria phaeospora]
MVRCPPSQTSITVPRLNTVHHHINFEMSFKKIDRRHNNPSDNAGLNAEAGIHTAASSQAKRPVSASGKPIKSALRSGSRSKYSSGSSKRAVRFRLPDRSSPVGRLDSESPFLHKSLSREGRRQVGAERGQFGTLHPVEDESHLVEDESHLAEDESHLVEDESLHPVEDESPFPGANIQSQSIQRPVQGLSLYEDPTPPILDKGKAAIRDIDSQPVEDAHVISSSQVSEPKRPKRKTTYNYARYLDRPLTILAALAWRQALDRDEPVIRSMQETDWRVHAVQLLCSMDFDVVALLASGGLAREYRENPTTSPVRGLCVDTAWAEDGNHEAPCIYTVELCDTMTGMSPTPTQLLQVKQRLRLYAELNSEDKHSIQDILEVENAGRQSDFLKPLHIEQGRRYYLRVGGGSALDRVDKINKFCDALEHRLHKLPQDEWDEPLQRALRYIGYAMRFSSHKQQHDADKSSSWLMHLVKACCIVVLNESGQTWGLEYYVVCYCANEKEIPVAELLLTLLADALHDTGGGFCVHPAGQNVSSSLFLDRNHQQAAMIWSEREAFRHRNTGFNRNMARECRRAEQYQPRPLPVETTADKIERLRRLTKQGTIEVAAEERLRREEMDDGLRHGREFIDKFVQNGFRRFRNWHMGFEVELGQLQGIRDALGEAE